MGEGRVRESGMHMDTRLCLTWRTSKDLLGSPGKSAQCHVAAGMGGESGGEGIRVYVCGWVPSLSSWNCQTLFIGYNPIENAKLIFKKRAL